MCLNESQGKPWGAKSDKWYLLTQQNCCTHASSLIAPIGRRYIANSRGAPVTGIVGDQVLRMWREPAPSARAYAQHVAAAAYIEEYARIHEDYE